VIELYANISHAHASMLFLEINNNINDDYDNYFDNNSANFQTVEMVKTPAQIL
jgi:hypothetical protein